MARILLDRITHVPAPRHEVFRFFSDPRNLAHITPPQTQFRILSAPDRPLREGDRIEYSIRVFGITMRWTTLITFWLEDDLFADAQERGPFRYWLHTHAFRDAGQSTEMRDRVEYELPMGGIGRLLAGWLIARQLREIFSYRARTIGRIFAEQQRPSQQEEKADQEIYSS